MKAIILAAGVGRRLQEVTQGQPKCLVEIGGQTLLARHIACLAQLGVDRIVLVVGFAQEAIRADIADNPFSEKIALVVNEQFTRGSVTSLWEARDQMDDDVILMDADVLYAPEILARLVASPHPSALLMDESVKQSTEECMVAAKNGRVLSLSKRLPTGYDETGEGVGFLKVQKADVPSLLRSVGGCIQDGKLDMEYEDALTDFFREVPVRYEKIGGLPWVEIDFPEDIQRAVTQILPAIETLKNPSPALR